MGAGELLLVFGPPAVGKMAVGRAICARSDFRLFHNHHTIEPLLEVFGYGTPGFTELNGEFRRRVVEVAAHREVRLIFTFVWDVDLQEDADHVASMVAPFARRARPVSFLELQADLGTRLARNRQPDRLAAKPSKRDLAWSDANVREMETHRMSTVLAESSPAAQILAEHPHLALDNSQLSPEAVADRALTWMGARPA